MAIGSVIKNSLTSRSFFAGLGGIALFYAALSGWVYVGGDTALRDLGERLASQTVAIKRDARSQAPDEHVGADIHQEDKLAAHDMVTPKNNAYSESAHIPDSPVTQIPHNQGVHDPSVMVQAPMAGFFEPDSHGDLLPVKRKGDGLSPFHVYRKPFVIPATATPLIAIAIDDFGLNNALSSTMAADLPEEVSFIVSPYAHSAEALQKVARGHGHELWLKLPMENQNFPYDEPGAKGILSRATLNTNMQSMKWALSRFSGYAGIAPYFDLGFAKARPMLGALIKENYDRGLGYFEINPSAPDQVKEISGRTHAPYIRNEIAFHDPKWNGELAEAWDLLERIAQSKGYASGVFKPYPETLAFLKEKLPTLAAAGYTLVPLSTLHVKNHLEAAAMAEGLIESGPPDTSANHKGEANVHGASPAHDAAPHDSKSDNGHH